MSHYTCTTCGAQYDASDQPPGNCSVCSDDRQYVLPSGQKWATREELIEQGYHNVITQVEPGVHSITVEPKLGIGQQAFLIQTPGGNVLWDCLGFLHPDFIKEVVSLGGIKSIAVSHPHFYTPCVDWAEAFDCQVHLPEHDSKWVMRPSPRLSFWTGESKQLMPGAEIIRLGGHFPGSSVLLWRDGSEGCGSVFAGDTLFPTPDQKWVSIMYSFPCLVPLPAQQATRIRRRLEGYSFECLYGAFPHTLVPAGAADVVQRSLQRYSDMLEGNIEREFY
ncbi:hypothetical protein N2152v2_008755 [Parachlorella kessleri]